MAVGDAESVVIPGDVSEGTEVLSLLYGSTSGEAGRRRDGRGVSIVEAIREHLEGGPVDASVKPGVVTDLDVTRSGRHLFLLFGDGAEFEDARFELTRRGWNGHFFVTAEAIGADWGVDPAVIRSLDEEGHVIGVVSTSSTDGPAGCEQRTDEMMIRQWRQSCDRVSRITGDPCIMGLLPESDPSAAKIRSAVRAGLWYLFTAEARRRPRVMDDCVILGCVRPGLARSVNETSGGPDLEDD